MTDNMLRLAERFGEHFIQEIVQWIGFELEPEDVFEPRKLQEWAEANGYMPTESVLLSVALDSFRAQYQADMEACS